MRSSRIRALLLSACTWACSDGSNDDGAESNGSVGGSGSVAMGGSGGVALGGSGGVAMGGSGGAGGQTAGGGQGGGNGAIFSEPGVCGVRATGVVTVDDFQVTEQRYLLGNDGFGPDICTISVQVTRAGDAPPGCDENAGQQTECKWTHLVQYDNPTVVLDQNGVCANSELGMDADAIAALDGVQMAFGYVFEFQGHNSVLMTYDDEEGIWKPGINVGWDETSGDFLFDERRGFCNYAPGPMP